MELMKETIAVGLLVVVVGYLVCKLVGMVDKTTKSVCDNWSKNYTMEITLFLIGVSVHLICEFSGINQWYCKNGNACKSQ